jgi:membrane-associated protein
MPPDSASTRLDLVLDVLRDQNLLIVCAALFGFLVLDGMLLVGLVIPADALILLAGTTASGPADVALVIASGAAGCVTGASAGHFLGRRYGSRLLHGRWGSRIGDERWRQARDVLNRSGPALALSYFLPVMDSLIPVLAGTLGMPYRRFIGWVVLGGTAWVSADTIAGYAAAEIGNGYLLLAVAVVLIGASTAVRLRRSRRTEDAETPETADAA